MMLIQPTARGWTRYRQRALAGPPLPGDDVELVTPVMAKENVLANLAIIEKKYGYGAIKHNSAEFANIMQALVAPFFPPDEYNQQSWQYCTINAWLDGIPSEDELSLLADVFSSQSRLEDTCGDHTTFGSQYDEAFDDLKSAGCPQAVINFLREKGNAARGRGKRKAAEKEAEINWEKAKSDAKDALNPFSMKSPFFWGLLAVAAVFIFLKRPARVIVQQGDSK